MRLGRLLPAVLLGCCLTHGVAHAAPPTGRLLVTLEPARGDGAGVRASGASLAGRLGARVSGATVPQLDLVTVRPRPGASVAALAREMRAQPGVAAVDPEQRAEPRAVPNDPALVTLETAPGTPPGTPVQWWAERQGLFAAWDVPQARGATVAVIDSGIDAGHPDLVGRIAAAVDNDDVIGHGPADVDESGHGTHVASLACATADNAVGIAGAGYGCRLLVYKTDFTDSSVAQSIVQATDAGADAITMSFGTTGDVAASRVIRRALRYAYDRRVVLVAAAADEPTERQGYPSDVLQPAGTGGDLRSGIGLSVTAADFSDQRASFAGFGSEISLAAYGAWGAGPEGPRGLLGAFPAGTVDLERPAPGDPLDKGCECRTTFGQDPRWAYVQGTSMAVPAVAATAAMVRRLNPDLGAGTVIRLLKQTARRPAGAAWEPNLGWGILDAGAALNAARTLDRRPPATRVTIARPRSTRITLRVVGVDRAPEGVQASGIARYDVLRSIDGRPVRRVARLTSRKLRLTVRRGPRYAYWAVATDAAGNRERRLARPDAVVRLRGPS